MNPLICFFEHNLFIYTLDYEVINCPPTLSVQVFLKQIEEKYFEKLKVVQVNFEFDHPERFEHQTALYQCPKAKVYVIRYYELKTLSEIKAASLTLDMNTEDIHFKPLMSKNDFIAKVQTIQQDICEGRLYQVNLTAPLEGETSENALNLFFKYEEKFQSQYKVLLPGTQLDIISFSPELFIENINETLTTRPIKGSSGSATDFVASLYKNKKEEAELSMIVDLLRNDLNSLGEAAAEVMAHRAPLQLGYIQHTYSEIKIKNNLPLGEVLGHMMPGGSISGCPKLESLKVIGEVEPYRRQIYTGTLGWWKKNDFKLNLAIRTFIKTGDKIFYHAGCGIVFDSDAELEWSEFLLKTGGLHVKV